MWIWHFRGYKVLFWAAVLYTVILAGSVYAKGELRQEQHFSCALADPSGEPFNIGVNAVSESEISLEINGTKVSGLFVPNLSSPINNFAFATSIVGQVYTLIIHTAPFLPHPDGYDAQTPPASLTIHSSDLPLEPQVKVFVGHCTLS